MSRRLMSIATVLLMYLLRKKYHRMSVPNEKQRGISLRAIMELPKIKKNGMAIKLTISESPQ